MGEGKLKYQPLVIKNSSPRVGHEKLKFIYELQKHFLGAS